MEDSASYAMLETVKQFAADLSKLKHEEQAERVELKASIELQMTALRQDFYGSILYLDQRVVAMDKDQNEARRQGQRKQMYILVGILIALLVIAGVVVWLAVHIK